MTFQCLKSSFYRFDCISTVLLVYKLLKSILSTTHFRFRTCLLNDLILLITILNNVNISRCIVAVYSALSGLEFSIHGSTTPTYTSDLSKQWKFESRAQQKNESVQVILMNLFVGKKT